MAAAFHAVSRRFTPAGLRWCIERCVDAGTMSQDLLGDLAPIQEHRQGERSEVLPVDSVDSG